MSTQDPKSPRPGTTHSARSRNLFQDEPQTPPLNRHSAQAAPLNGHGHIPGLPEKPPASKPPGSKPPEPRPPKDEALARAAPKPDRPKPMDLSGLLGAMQDQLNGLVHKVDGLTLRLNESPVAQPPTPTPSRSDDPAIVEEALSLLAEQVEGMSQSLLDLQSAASKATAPLATRLDHIDSVLETLTHGVQAQRDPALDTVLARMDDLALGQQALERRLEKAFSAMGARDTAALDQKVTALLLSQEHLSETLPDLLKDLQAALPSNEALASVKELQTGLTSQIEALSKNQEDTAILTGLSREQITAMQAGQGKILTALASLHDRYRTEAQAAASRMERTEVAVGRRLEDVLDARLAPALETALAQAPILLRLAESEVGRLTEQAAITTALSDLDQRVGDSLDQIVQPLNDETQQRLDRLTQVLDALPQRIAADTGTIAAQVDTLATRLNQTATSEDLTSLLDAIHQSDATLTPAVTDLRALFTQKTEDLTASIEQQTENLVTALGPALSPVLTPILVPMLAPIRDALISQGRTVSEAASALTALDQTLPLRIDEVLGKRASASQDQLADILAAISTLTAGFEDLRNSDRADPTTALAPVMAETMRGVEAKLDHIGKSLGTSSQMPADAQRKALARMLLALDNMTRWQTGTSQSLKDGLARIETRIETRIEAKIENRPEPPAPLPVASAPILQDEAVARLEEVVSQLPVPKPDISALKRGFRAIDRKLVLIGTRVDQLADAQGLEMPRAPQQTPSRTAAE